MRLLEIGMYIVVIIIVMLLFQQIVNVLYNLSFSITVGEMGALFYLGLIWTGLYLLIRIVLAWKKKRRSNVPQYVVMGGMGHIGVCLAIFCYNTNPLLLLIFPIVIGIAYKVRSSSTFSSRAGRASRPIHPHLVDERNGSCVLRTGTKGFTFLKFFNIAPSLPLRDFLLYLYHEQVECTLEVQRTASHLQYLLVLITRGRNYDAAHERCLALGSSLRQFLRQEEVVFEDASDVLSILQRFYAPYFLYTASPLDLKGIPTEFPQVILDQEEILIEQEFEECHFAVSAILPKAPSGNTHEFLENLDENFFYQLHLRPLNAVDLESQEDLYNRQYRDSLKRLTEGLEEDAEFTAANYLFASLGQPSKENIEPLLNQSEIARLKELKRQMHQVKVGREIGMWELDLHLLGSPVLAKTIAIKLGGTFQELNPQQFFPVSVRESTDQPHIVTSQELLKMLPLTDQGEGEGFSNEVKVEDSAQEGAF